MKTINNEFHQNIFEFVTPSNLQVFYIHRPGFKKSSAVYATGFGALDLVQEFKGRTITHKQGLAHFLEHKLFEEEGDIDILSKFSDMGANANAFTSYDATMYTFNFTGPIQEPLETLIDFVSHFEINEASVEKEKGIIVEELRMYDQMPEARFFKELNRNIFHNFPYIHDIGGTESSVNSTTLNDLKQAYQLNYDDSKMVLVVVGHEEPQHIQEIVMGYKSEVNSPLDVVTVFETEPHTVYEPYREITMAVERDKLGLAYKFQYSSSDEVYDEFLIKMALELTFSDMNPDFQTWRDQKLITQSFFTDIAVKQGIGVIYFFDENVDQEKFVNFVESQIAHVQSHEELFSQLQRRYYGEMIFGLSQMESTAVNVASYYLQGNDYLGFLSKIKASTYDDMCQAIDRIGDLSRTILKMKQL